MIESVREKDSRLTQKKEIKIDLFECICLQGTEAGTFGIIVTLGL